VTFQGHFQSQIIWHKIVVVQTYLSVEWVRQQNYFAGNQIHLQSKCQLENSKKTQGVTNKESCNYTGVRTVLPLGGWWLCQGKQHRKKGQSTACVYSIQGVSLQSVFSL